MDGRLGFQDSITGTRTGKKLTKCHFFLSEKLVRTDKSKNWHNLESFFLILAGKIVPNRISGSRRNVGWVPYSQSCFFSKLRWDRRTQDYVNFCFYLSVLASHFKKKWHFVNWSLWPIYETRKWIEKERKWERGIKNKTEILNWMLMIQSQI